MSLDQQSPPSTASPTTTSGFVYPVKSLLNGKIQRSVPNCGPGLSRSRSEESIHALLVPGSLSRSVYGSNSSSVTSASVHSQPPQLGRNSQATRLRRSNSTESSHDLFHRRSPPAGVDDMPGLNYRYYPAEETINRTSTRTFATATPSDEAVRLVSSPALVMEALSSRFNQRTSIGHEAEPPGQRWPPSEIVAHLDDALASTKGSHETLTDPISPPEPFNPSQYGLVHLPPVSPKSSSTPISPRSISSSRSSNANTARVSSGRPPNSAQGGSPTKGRSLLEPTGSQLIPSILGSEGMDNSSDSTSLGNLPSYIACQEDSSPNFEPIRPPTPSSEFPTFAAVSSDQSHVHTTLRFRHEEDENGNHIVVGREGTLFKCEDEPIHAPGAVQGYGVLIVVEETDGALVVRQVSENSDELLGLPPKYLFSLECFTDTLSTSQAELLWDNIQFLEESPQWSSENEDFSPHVFLLSGLSAPMSSDVPDPDHKPLDKEQGTRRVWTCWCAVHRPQGTTQKSLIIMEFELERDTLNPLYPLSDIQSISSGSASPHGSTTSNDSLGSSNSPLPIPSPSSSGNSHSVFSPATAKTDDEWAPNAEDIIESTTSHSKPIPALERLRRLSQHKSQVEMKRPRHRRRRGSSTYSTIGGGVGMMDVFAVVSQINEQLSVPAELDLFLKVAAGVIKDITQFHRVMVYQFDDEWNGIVVAELVDWTRTHELYRGLQFPASDIPAQARELYMINKVRILYDRAQTTARIVARSQEDLVEPLDMSHCYLRAMSPIHIKYLTNMGVRASMSISITAFGALWGLVACHSFGDSGMRVSFPVRQMLRLLSQSISRNIERLSYARRLHTRKLINTLSSDIHPSGYIVSDADDLLSLFDADFGVLVVGDGAKILGPNQHGQEILIVAEYLRLKQFETIHASQAVISDFPDLNLTAGLEIIAGILYVPLSGGGKDFIAFLRKGQLRAVRWAGKPQKHGDAISNLEPRKSFKTWSELVAGRCRSWTDEQLDTACVLALVYGKFIHVWRQKQEALHATQLTNLLLSNASHEVRTSLNHIINYLELALNGQLDGETRDNLTHSHTASKSLLFTINDLLDLTRLESGGETSFEEVFNLVDAIIDATRLYDKEAQRKGVNFVVDVSNCPTFVVGDARKVVTVVQNLTANALKFTEHGSISVSCTRFDGPEGSWGSDKLVVDILVADTGCGIPPEKLECMLREFEQVEPVQPKINNDCLGLGLAVVVRIVGQLGGQLRVDSNVQGGTRFSLLIPFSLADKDNARSYAQSSKSSRSSLRSLCMRSREGSASSGKGSELETLVEAISSDHMRNLSQSPRVVRPSEPSSPPPTSSSGQFEVTHSCVPIRPVKIDRTSLDHPVSPTQARLGALENDSSPDASHLMSNQSHRGKPSGMSEQLRILVVEDNHINRAILSKRLCLDGHAVVGVTNGREGVEKVENGDVFDLVLMDIQMPILNGFQATEGIRSLEKLAEAQAGRSSQVSRRLGDRLPIFAVSASLKEDQRDELASHGMDGWILKPIDFKRLRMILRGLTEPEQRQKDSYRPGYNWEAGGWLCPPSTTQSSSTKPFESPLAST